MTWLYLPPEAMTHAMKQAPHVMGKEDIYSDYPCAPVQEGLTLASILQSLDIELWVMSSGTATQRPRSWPGWRTKPWIARLSGTMLPALMANHGAAWWISSMAAIRASHLALLEKSLAIKTHAISGRTSPASCARWNPPSASLKMSADIYDWGSSRSRMTFNQWVIRLRQACLQRKKSVRRTSVNASSSWLTPRAQESGEKQETFLKRNADRTDRCSSSLTAQTILWPTATAMDAKVKVARSPDKMIRKDRRNVLRTPGLAETVLQPNAYPYSKEDLELAKQGKPYRTTRVQWPTPRAQEPGSTSADHGISLNEVSKMWSTPVERDWKEGFLINNKTATRSNLSRQAPRIKLGGKHCSDAPRTLNPLFVEALMGWPQGWTIAWTDCGSAVTGLSRWLQLMRCALSALPQEYPSPMQQNDEQQLCLI